jgi:hypothetical protein
LPIDQPEKNGVDKLVWSGRHGIVGIEGQAKTPITIIKITSKGNNKAVQ